MGTKNQTRQAAKAESLEISIKGGKAYREKRINA
jgi:hypothetical protein